MIATRIAAPTKAPRIVPPPPESATPPRTAATIEFKFKTGADEIVDQPDKPAEHKPGAMVQEVDRGTAISTSIACSGPG